MKYDVLGVKIDQVTMAEAVEQVVEWVEGRSEVRAHSLEVSKTLSSQLSALSSKYVVTPNVEFLMLAQKDLEFRRILNEADLAIPDSARLSWAYKMIHFKNPLLKIFYWLVFFLPPKWQLHQFDVVTGTDLMDQLIKISNERGFRVGFLGGREKLADRLSEVLTKKYPKLKIAFASSEVVVSQEGEIVSVGEVGGVRDMGLDKGGKGILKIPSADILFVALGQGKQEKWIVKNLGRQPVKVMIGVGGAFDYLSGEVARAPKLMRNLGLEWLYRIVNQPWRARRFLAIFGFIGKVLVYR